MKNEQIIKISDFISNDVKDIEIKESLYNVNATVEIDTDPYVNTKGFIVFCCKRMCAVFDIYGFKSRPFIEESSEFVMRMVELYNVSGTLEHLTKCLNKPYVRRSLAMCKYYVKPSIYNDFCRIPLDLLPEYLSTFYYMIDTLLRSLTVGTEDELVVRSKVVKRMIRRIKVNK